MPDKNCKTCHGLGGYPMCPECKNADDKGHCISLSGSIQLEQSVIRIKGHGERIANAYVDGYYFLETDTDGPFIDTVHESFVESNT